jgi:hypothetical protein
MTADPRTVVLAFDFPGRRAAAGFDLLFQQLPDLRGTLVTLPQEAHPYLASSYADAAVAAVAPGEAVLAVAFCSAAPLAQDALARLAASGVDTVGLLLADPVLPGEFTVRDGLSSTLGQIETVDAPPLVDALLQDRSWRLAPLAWRRKVLRTIRESLSAAFRCEPDDEVVVGLSSRYLSYLDFVLAALSSDYRPCEGPSVALSSTDHRTPRPWPGLPSLVRRRTGAARRDLIRSPEFTAQLLDLLGAAGRR